LVTPPFLPWFPPPPCPGTHFCERLFGTCQHPTPSMIAFNYHDFMSTSTNTNTHTLSDEIAGAAITITYYNSFLSNSADEHNTMKSPPSFFSQHVARQNLSSTTHTRSSSPLSRTFQLVSVRRRTLTQGSVNRNKFLVSSPAAPQALTTAIFPKTERARRPQPKRGGHQFAVICLCAPPTLATRLCYLGCKSALRT